MDGNVLNKLLKNSSYKERINKLLFILQNGNILKFSRSDIKNINFYIIRCRIYKEKISHLEDLSPDDMKKLNSIYEFTQKLYGVEIC